MTGRPGRRSTRTTSGVLLTTLSASALATAAAASPSTPADRLLTVQDPRIAEASGLVAGTSPGVFFLHEDADRPALVHAIDEQGRTQVVVELPGVENVDWEDMARGTDEQGNPALFVGDLGNAYSTLRRTAAPSRTSFAILRFTEPTVETDGPAPTGRDVVTAQDVTVFDVTYADGEPRNAEALAVLPGTNQVFVVDKVGTGGRLTWLWTTEEPLSPEGPNVLTRVAQLPVAEVTGADFSPDGDLLAVRDPTTAHLWRVQDGDVAAAVAAEPVSVPLPLQRQGESIAFAADGRSLLVGTEGVRQAVYEVPVPEELTEQTVPPATTPGDGDPAPRSFVAPLWATTTVVGAVASLAVVLLLRHRRRAS